jgi:hypothetical protein
MIWDPRAGTSLDQNGMLEEIEAVASQRDMYKAWTWRKRICLRGEDQHPTSTAHEIQGGVTALVEQF